MSVAVKMLHCITNSLMDNAKNRNTATIDAKKHQFS